MEETMLQLWEEVFGRAVTAGQDFFLDLGGDSIQALQLTDMIVDIFAAPISVADLFDNPTPDGLISAVQRLRSEIQ